MVPAGARNPERRHRPADPVGHMTRATRISYAFVVGLLVLAATLHITTPLITVLFAFFAMSRLSFWGRRWLGVTLFAVLFAAVLWSAGYFAKQAVVALPRLGEEAIPKVIGYAEAQGLPLPFSDWESLKSLALEKLQEQAASVGSYARRTVVELVSCVVGVIVAVSLFLGGGLDLAGPAGSMPRNLYSAVAAEVVNRCRNLYESFATVMGAQLVISAINTVLTAGFMAWNHFPHLALLLMLTFVFGMVPIVGNLISNTLIIGVGFSISPTIAGAAFVFLVVVHKLEYLLNSKIIGVRIQNPMWLTLLALILGERLMGIPGMILAPVVLHYVRTEAAAVPVAEEAPNP